MTQKQALSLRIGDWVRYQGENRQILSIALHGIGGPHFRFPGHGLTSYELCGLPDNRLTPDTAYDLDGLIVTGWTEGDGSGHDGYHWQDYFDATGRYLGPDEHGIEPTFTTTDGQLGGTKGKA